MPSFTVSHLLVLVCLAFTAHAWVNTAPVSPAASLLSRPSRIARFSKQSRTDRLCAVAAETPAQTTTCPPTAWSLPQAVTSTLLVGQILLSSLCLNLAALPSPATASSYGSLSDEQKVVAEAWRLVDNSYLDRTFGGLDWFGLRDDYVKRTKYASMDDAHDAIGTLVSKLGDKYTRYLSPSQYQSLVDSATGTLAGVGIEIAKQSSGDTKDRIYASDIQDNSPARKAGIQPGDVFVSVDGADFVDGTTNTPDDVATKLRGPKGSRVGVVMQRNGKTLDFILERDQITVTSVRSYMSNGKVGVVRIKNFSGTTASTVAQKLKELAKQGATSYVVDVRGNPGGLLPGGVDTAALFLEQNQPIVFVVNKQGVVDSQATLADGMDTTSPLVVLVDSGTASAAEVFGAALQENNRATIVGEQTFGKGIVQTIRELSDKNGGIAITVARYETPQHHDINKQGIAVNVKAPVDCPKDDAMMCLKGISQSSLFVAPKSS